MSLFKRRQPHQPKASVYETIAALETEEDIEALIVPEETHTASAMTVLPAGVIDTLGAPGKARKGAWHTPCVICGDPFKATDTIRAVLYSDGSRPYVHEWHLAAEKGEPEACEHGIVPSSACTWCNGSERPIYPKSKAFRSKRQGTCVICQAEFTAGTLIQKTASAEGLGWSHAWHTGGTP